MTRRWFNANHCLQKTYSLNTARNSSSRFYPDLISATAICLARHMAVTLHIHRIEKKHPTLSNPNTYTGTRKQHSTSSSNQSSAHKSHVYNTYAYFHIPCTKPTSSEPKTPAARTQLVKTRPHNRLIPFSSSPKSRSAERVLCQYFPAKRDGRSASHNHLSSADKSSLSSEGF